MSYTIIRSVSIVHDKNDNLYHLKITGCDNNVYPHHYHPFTTSGGYESKDRATIEILDAYLTGEFQGGSNDYSKFVKYFERGLIGEDLKKKLDALSSLENKYWTRYADDKDYNKWSKINARISKWRYEIRKSNAMLEAFKEFKTASQTGKFRILLDGYYIFNVRDTRHGISAKYGYYKDSAKIFDRLEAEYIKLRFSNHSVTLEAA